MRFFNTEGPVNCADHYCLSPLTRVDLAEIIGADRARRNTSCSTPRARPARLPVCWR